jgi:hypothetical protein
MQLDEFLRGIEDDPTVVGVVPHGSYGKRALVHDGSDVDVFVVVTGDVDVYAERFAYPRGGSLECWTLGLDEFRAFALHGHEHEWNRPAFTHVRALVDRLDGEIQRLVDAKGALAPDEARALAAEALDGYLNLYYRSAKNAARGLTVESALDAAESVPWFLTTLFALHERVRPFNKYLGWELREHPLGGDEWSAEALLPRLTPILAGDLAEERSLFRSMERLARERGLGHVVDGWEPDVAFLREG